MSIVGAARRNRVKGGNHGITQTHTSSTQEDPCEEEKEK